MASVAHNSTSSLNMQFEQTEEKVQKHLNLTSVLRQVLPVKKMQLDGKYLRVDFQTAGNSYGAARSPGAWQPGYNPSATYDDGFAEYTVKQMKFYSKDVYMSTDFTGQMKTAVKSKKGGYQNLVDFRFQDTVDHLSEVTAKILGTTRLGTVGKVAAGSSGTTVKLDYAGVNTFEAGNRYIRPGMRISVASASRTGALNSGSNDQGNKVTAVARDLGSSGTPTVDITIGRTPTTMADNDFITVFGERSASAIASSATGYEDDLYRPLGLIDCIDDGDYSAYYGALQRSAAGHESLNATVLDNSGTARALTRGIINHAVDQHHQLWGGKPKVAYSTFGVQRKFVDFLNGQAASSVANDNPERFENIGGTKVKIGFNSYDVFPLGLDGKLMMAPDRLAPHHTMVLVDPAEMVLIEDGPPEFIKYDGNTIRKVSGKDEATADWVYRAVGYVARFPGKAGIRIDDLSGEHVNQ